MKLEIEASSIQELAVALNKVLHKLLIEDSYMDVKEEMLGKPLLPYETDIGGAHCKLTMSGDEYADVWAQYVNINRSLRRIHRALDPNDVRSPLEEVEPGPEGEKVYRVKQVKESYDLSGDRRTQQDALIDNLALNW